MKGVILAGGKGTRLFPLTKVTNKHLLPVGTEPMIYNPIRQLISCGIKDILIVTSTEHMGDMVNLLGSGHELEVEFTYKVQEDAKGIAHALLLAENFTHGDRICVILGDNIASHSIAPFAKEFLQQKEGAKVLLRRVSDPERYGIAALDERKIIEIQEKPEKPKSNYAVIGYYMYDEKVFDIIREQEFSTRGELEITDVNNAYVKKGTLTYGILEGEWTDAGTMESFRSANKIMIDCNNEIKG